MPPQTAASETRSQTPNADPQYDASDVAAFASARRG
jgi:hypothetical protein